MAEFDNDKPLPWLQKSKNRNFRVNFLKLYKHRYKIICLLLVVIVVTAHVQLYPAEYCLTKRIPFKDDDFTARVSSLRRKLKKQICNNISIPIPKEKFSFPKTTNHSDCSLPYITINDKGGLGNKICQYLSLIFLKDFFDVRIAVHPKMYHGLRTNFKHLEAPLLNRQCHSYPPYNLTYVEIYRNLFYDAASGVNPQSRLNQSIYIDDYPCPVSLLAYFKEYAKSNLIIKDEVKRLSEGILQSLYQTPIFDKRKTLVSVHVRRDDYFRHMVILYNRSVITPCFYHNALNYFREKFNDNVLFIVSSDDLAWCRQHLSAPDVIIAGTGEVTEPIFDFTMLSLCDHHIRGLGTFGFLSALFGNGTIMFPLVDTLKLSEIEASYICTSTERFLAMLDEPLGL